MSSSAYSRAQISINSYHIVAYAPLTEAKRTDEWAREWLVQDTIPYFHLEDLFNF